MSDASQQAYTLEQSIAILDRAEGDLLVAAAAGSGKTMVLTERIFQRAVAGLLEWDQVLIATFTNRAARQLRDKLLHKLLQARQDLQNGTSPALFLPEARALSRDALQARLEKLIAELPQAQLSTLHSFCLKLLRRYPDCYRDERGELIFAPSFAILEDYEAQLLLEQALDSVMEQAYRLLELAEGVKAAAAATAGTEATAGAGKPQFERVSEPAWQAAADLRMLALFFTSNNYDDSDFREKILDRYQQFRALGAYRTRLDEQLRRYEELAAAPLEPEADEASILKKQHAPLRAAFYRLLLDLDRAYTALKRARQAADYADFEHGALAVLQARPELRLREFYIDEYQDTTPLQDEILQALGARYRFRVGDLKQSIYRFRNADPTLFSDYIAAAEELLRPADMPAAEKLLAAGDWPRLQALVDAKAASPKRLVWLRKNFRSHPNLIELLNLFFIYCLQKRLPEEPSSEPVEPSSESVETSSMPAEPSSESVETSSEPAESLGAAADAGRLDSSEDEQVCAISYDRGQVLVPREEPSQDGQQRLRIVFFPSKKQDKAAEAESDETEGEVSDAEGRMVLQSIREACKDKYTYGDIAILCRNRKSCSQYHQLLEDAGIPVVGGQNRSFWEDDEVQLIGQLIELLLNGDNDLALASLMLSELSPAPFDENDCLKIAAFGRRQGPEGQRLSFAQAVQAYVAAFAQAASAEDSASQDAQPKHASQDAQLEFKSQDAQQKFTPREPERDLALRLEKLLTTLNRWRCGIAQCEAATLLREIIAERAWRPSRAESQERLEAFLAVLAKQSRKGLSLAAFWEIFRKAAAEERESEDGSQPQSGENAVQVMTMHAAKGLEFKLVILPGLGQNLGFARNISGDKLPFSLKDCRLSHRYLCLRDAEGQLLRPQPTLAELLQGGPLADPSWRISEEIGPEMEAHKRLEYERAFYEECRLLYVAMTRAEEELLLLASGSFERKDFANLPLEERLRIQDWPLDPPRAEGAWANDASASPSDSAASAADDPGPQPVPFDKNHFYRLPSLCYDKVKSFWDLFSVFFQLNWREAYQLGQAGQPAQASWQADASSNEQPAIESGAAHFVFDVDPVLSAESATPCGDTAPSAERPSWNSLPSLTAPLGLAAVEALRRPSRINASDWNRMRSQTADVVAGGSADPQRDRPADGLAPAPQTADTNLPISINWPQAEVGALSALELEQLRPDEQQSAQALQIKEKAKRVDYDGLHARNEATLFMRFLPLLSLQDLAKKRRVKPLKLKKWLTKKLDRLFAAAYFSSELYNADAREKCLRMMTAFLKSELGQALLAACQQGARIFRELPFTIPADGIDPQLQGALFQGTVNLAYEQDGRMVVVDFRADSVRRNPLTGQAMDEAAQAQFIRARYGQQLRAYAKALEYCFGRPCEACYIFLLREGRAVRVDK